MAANEDDWLAQEYLHLQKVVEDFDGKTLTIKAWSVTFSAAAIGFAYDKGERAILLVAIISAVAFWLVEALFKVNQQAYYRRVEELEAHFSGGERRRPFQIGRAWDADFWKHGGYVRVFSVVIWPHVFMPHAAIAAIAALLLAGQPPLAKIAADAGPAPSSPSSPRT
jgi:hypothetical protein